MTKVNLLDELLISSILPLNQILPKKIKINNKLNISIFSIFNNWLFDNQLLTELSEENNQQIFKYNSPINHVYILSLFIKNLKLNKYLNSWCNNYDLRYISIEDLSKFIKQCIIDYNINKFSLIYSKRKKYTPIFLELKKRYFNLKDNDILLLIDLIDQSENKQEFYNNLLLNDNIKNKKIKK